MAEDMRSRVSELEAQLRKAISKTKLSPEQKKLLREAMAFGYSTAFCERTSDMQGSYSAAERYREQYQAMMDSLK